MKDLDGLVMHSVSNNIFEPKNEIIGEIERLIELGEFIGGNAISNFENTLADYFHGKTEVVTCGSGSDALLLVLMGLGIGPGDEVIVPAFGYVSAVEAVCILGARPIFVDIDSKAFLALDLLSDAINRNTKAVVVMNLFGMIGEQILSILKLCELKGVCLVEDAAQSFGATRSMEGAVICSGAIDGVISTLSFFPTKPLGCYGDGGAITTSDPVLAATLRKIANHGQTRKYSHEVVGLNSRLDAIQAAVLCVKLKYFDSALKQRQISANYYLDRIAETAPLNDYITPIPYHPGSSWAQFTVLVDQRDQLANFLNKKNIPFAIHYPIPLPLQEGYKKYSTAEGSSDCPNAKTLSSQVISLPFYPTITTEHQDHILNALRKFYSTEY